MTEETPKQKLGRESEDLAADFLRQKGYTILERNFRSPWGEIDIVAQDKDFLVFVEVRSLSSDSLVRPDETITRSKKKKMVKSAQYYFVKKRLPETFSRFDVVAIHYRGPQPQITLFANAFSLEEI